jgi:acetyl esterase/lipase
MRTAFRNSIAATLIAAFLGIPTVVAQKPPALPDSVELLRDVVYGKGGDRPLKMNILRPKTPPKEPMPVLVWFHGGAWETGHRDGGNSRLAPFAERGYLCATVEYRFSAEAIFPAQIEDAKCAIRFLRAKAKDYNLNPDRIGAWGYSAGGHLVSLLGTAGSVKELEGKGGWPEYSSRVQAVCTFSGPADFLKWGDKAHPAVVKLLGGRVNDKKELAASGSAVTHVTKDCPPFLIVHGDKDATVPFSQAESLNEVLKKAGVDVTLLAIRDGSHTFGNPPELVKAVSEFFDKQLKKGK